MQSTIEIAAIVVGINHWEDVTGPFVRSLLEHEPRALTVVIDNASVEPYPALPGARVIHTAERLGYGAALNVGMLATPEADWHVCLNNDCMCHGPWAHLFEGLSDRAVYGSGESYDELMDITWLWSAWLCISKRARSEIGLYDERFDAGYEDTDYEQRARERGYELKFLDLPIEHLGVHTRYEERNYSDRYQKCKELFFTKHAAFRHLLEKYIWLPPEAA